MTATLTTERLRLDPVTAEHLPLMVDLNSDPEVMRFLLGRAATPAETYDEWSKRLGPQSDEARGLGYWAGFEGETFAGWWSASSFARDDTTAGLGYRLPRHAWGRGLATEGGLAMLRHAFAVPRIARAVASTMAVNHPSRRVLEKLGMRHVGTTYDDWPDPIPGSEQGDVVYELIKEPDPVALWDAEASSFDEPADHGLRDPAVRAVWRELLIELMPPAPARIADLGCGTGTLSALLADEGYDVTGVDFSPEMIVRARHKAPSVEFVEADASAPPLALASYDVVLSRHVLWAMPDPAAALGRWVDLLRPGGRLVLVEGSWSTGAGLTGAETVALVEGLGRHATLLPLTQPAYWGREIDDERYVVTG
jgi:RimJ/RimL family protein N-acetyltransferase